MVKNNPDDILGMSDLLGQVEQSSDSDLRDDGGLEKLVRETGTTESVQTSGTGGGDSIGGGGY